MIFRLALKEEIETIVDLYYSVKGDEYCVWNELYPTIMEANHDFETNNLFVVAINNKVVASVSIVPENEMDEFDEWCEKVNVAEIGRVVVNKNYRGLRIGKFLLENVIEEIKKRNYNSIHLSTAVINTPAQKIYEKLDFKIVGEKFMWGNSYYLCELVLKEGK